jgi:integrase
MKEQSINDLFNEWQENVLCLKSKATQSTVSYRLRRFIKIFGNLTLADITQEGIQKHIVAVSQEMKANSLHTYWGSIQMLLNYAKKKNATFNIPKPDFPSIQVINRPWLTNEQMQQLIQTAPEKDRLGYYLLAETGLRISEAMLLNIADIDFDNQLLRVRHIIKTPRSLRTLSISTYLSNKILENGLSTFSRYELNKLMLKLGYEQRGYHSFRRGNATLMAKIGVPPKIAAMRLGHSFPGLSYGLYAQNEIGSDKNWAGQISEFLV